MNDATEVRRSDDRSADLLVTDSPSFPAGSERLIYRLRRLGNAGAVLHVGAHPDDEDSGLLPFLAHGIGVRTVYWSATRGEGGQNRLGIEHGEALGILRTWESLYARHVDGAEALFGPFYDYGFSKHGDDALRRWGREDLVRELVRAIRIVQPAIVVSRWSGDAEDGHGHHQAVGLAMAEAFDAAADPSLFPELADAGLPAWTALRMYRSVGGDWQPGEDAEFGVRVAEYERDGYVRIDTGRIDPVVGLSYQEQGHRAINRHRSQGIGCLPEPGPYYYYYRLERNLAGEPSAGDGLFGGLDISLAGLADHFPAEAALIRGPLAEAVEHAGRAVDSFHPERPTSAGLAAADGASVLERLRRDLVASGGDVPAALDAYLAGKALEFEQVAATCLGVRVECLLDRPRTTPGRPVNVRARVLRADPESVDVSSLRLEAPSGWIGADGVADAAAEEAEWEISPPQGALPTVPYWLREPREPYRYRWPPSGPLALPFESSPVAAAAEVEVASRRLRLRASALHRSAFPGGFRELPLAVLPDITVRPKDSYEIVPSAAEARAIELVATVRCVDDAGAAGLLVLKVPEGWEASPRHFEIAFDAADEQRTVAFDVTIPGGTASGVYELVYELSGAGALELDPTRLASDGGAGPADEANCAAEAFRVRRASVEVALIDADFVRTLRYGYVEGMDESILRSLERFALDVSPLDDEDLAFGDLDRFDAVVVGPNAYNTRSALRQNAARMLSYVASGGTLVVQYQGYGYGQAGLAPYPFKFSQPHDRVTDPQADVEFLAPDHALMQLPNRLTGADFDGWVHDRGLYFFGDWDPAYEALLAASDTGEEPKRGGLLVASYGRGTYAYVGYSLNRQIPGGVPGAIRLFANLLGLAHARVLERAALLRGVELFASLPDEDLYQGARAVSERWVPSGEELVREGERGNEMFILREGRLAAVRGSGPAERVVEVVHPGGSVGEIAVLAGTPRAATVRAEEDSHVLVLPSHALNAWIRRDPDLALRLMKRMAHLIVDQGAGP